MVRRLFKGVRERDQRWLAERTAEQLHADGKTAGCESGRHADRRKARLCRQPRVAADLVASHDRRNPPRRRIRESVEPVVVHYLEDCLTESCSSRETALVIVAREVVVRNRVRIVEEALQLRRVKARREQFLHGRNRPAGLLQVVAQIELQLLRKKVGRGQLRGEVRHNDIDCRRLKRFHLVDGASNDGAYYRVFRRRAEKLGEYANTGALECIPLERRGVGPRNLTPACRGGRIRRIVAGSRVKNEGDVFHRPRDGPARVLGVAERDDARAARQAQRRPETDDVVVRAGDANRTARVGAQGDDGEVCCSGDGGATAAPAGRARQIVGIERLPAERADRREAQRKFVEVHLSQNYGARLAQLPHLEGVVFRHDARQRQRPARCRHVFRVEVVFEKHRDAVQRPAQPSALALLVQHPRIRRGIRVDVQDRVHARPRLVVGRDAVQIELDQLRGTCLRVRHRPLKLANALLKGVE